MTLRVEYTDGGDLTFELVENGKVIPKEEYNTKEKATLTALSSVMIPGLVEAVLDANDDFFGPTSLMFLLMNSGILNNIERRTKSEAEKSILKHTGAVKIAIDKNALREALKKEKEEQNRENNAE